MTKEFKEAFLVGQNKIADIIANKHAVSEILSQLKEELQEVLPEAVKYELDKGGKTWVFRLKNTSVAIMPLVYRTINLFTIEFSAPNKKGQICTIDKTKIYSLEELKEYIKSKLLVETCADELCNLME